MLNDQKRNITYQCAIERAVRDGYKTILDIGTGTGILSMMAVQAGATEVYACEKSKVMCQLARDVLQSNRMDNHINLIQKQSTEMEIPANMPKRVSLVITETFDAGLFGEHVLLTLQHAWQNLLLPPNPLFRTTNIYRNFSKKELNEQEVIKHNDSVTVMKENLLEVTNDKLKAGIPVSSENQPSTSLPMFAQSDFNDMKKETDQDLTSCTNFNQVNKFGKVIPHAARIWISLIECSWIRKCSLVQQIKLVPINFGEMIISSEDNPEEPYTTENLTSIPEGYKLLTDPAVLLDINFNNPQEIETLIKGHVMKNNFVCNWNGSLDAIAVWFDLYLDEDTMLSTYPGSDVCWEQAVFPIRPHHLHGASQKVSVGTHVEVQLLCEKYLKFGYIHLNQEETLSQEKEYMFLDSKIIQKLNDDVANSAIISAIYQSVSENKNLKLIDMTLFAWPALMICKLGASEAVITQLRLQEEICKIRNLSSIKKEQIKFSCVEDLSDFSTCFWDMLIVDLIELNGLMKNQVLEDIALLKASCLKETCRIVPCKLKSYMMLIQSPALLLQAKLIDDSRTLNFKIAEFINIFQAKTHQDIHLSTLQYEKLSEPEMMWEIDFNEPLPKEELPSFLNIQTAVDVKLISSGHLSAIVYWFELDYGRGNIVSTLDPNCSWGQAAVVPNDEITVYKDNVITLYCTCKNSVVDVQLEVASICPQGTSTDAPVESSSN
ncbi:protein arginine N-methyltransferase 9-like isoform X2 [Centruroides vittatus]